MSEGSWGERNANAPEPDPVLVAYLAAGGVPVAYLHRAARACMLWADDKAREAEQHD